MLREVTVAADAGADIIMGRVIIAVDKNATAT
jgi:hypothetical protein